MKFNDEVAGSAQDISRFFSNKFGSVFRDEALGNDPITQVASDVFAFNQTLSTMKIDVEMISITGTLLKSSFNPVPCAVLKKIVE